MISRLFSHIEYYILYVKYFLLYAVSFLKFHMSIIYEQSISQISYLTNELQQPVIHLIALFKQNASIITARFHIFLKANKTVILIGSAAYLGIYVFGYLIIFTIRHARYKVLLKKNTLIFSLVKKIKKQSFKQVFKKEFYTNLLTNIGRFITNLITEILLSIENKYGNLKIFREPGYSFELFSRIFFVIIKVTDIFAILLEKGLIALKVLKPKGTDQGLFLTTIEETDDKQLQRVIPEELQHEFHLTGDKQLNEYMDFVNAYKKPLLTAITKWKEKSLSSMLFVGKKGSGKSALIDLLMQRIPRGTEIVKILFEPDEFRKNIFNETLIKITGTGTLEKAVETLKAREKELVVILDNIHFLFFKDQSNIKAFLSFLSLIGNAGGNILWIATINEHSYKFISQFMPVNDTFDFKISINFMKTKDIKNIFINKAEHCGFSIYPRLTENQVKLAKKKIKKGEISYADLPNYILNEYFGKLVDKCENVFPALYHHFLRSISYVRNKRVYISEVNFRDLSFIQDFSNEYFLILTAVLIHEILTLDELVFLLGMNIERLNVYTSFLLKQKILEKYETGEKTFYRINPVYTIQISSILKGKNYFYF